MSGFSIRSLRLWAIFPGLLVGVGLGLWLTVTRATLESAPEHAGTISKNPETDIDKLTTAEIGKLTLADLALLHGIRKSPEAVAARKDPDKAAEHQQTRLGLENLRRLLPLARQLTVESLRNAQQEQHLSTAELVREEKLIARVNQIVLDPKLVNTAEVIEGHLSEIRISSDYAIQQVSDDEAIFLLGHELTHVAARSGGLKQLVENLRQTSEHVANVKPDEDQKEDLVCDFIAAQALKRFVQLNPTNESLGVRLARVIGYGSQSERLAQAWADFCNSYGGAPADEDHLSQSQTIQALVALDSELKVLVPQDPYSSLCH